MFNLGVKLRMEEFQKNSPVIRQANTIGAIFNWHFYEMPSFLFLVWKNYIEFVFNYFSIHLLFLTLFSPWRRYKWRYPRGFDIGGYLSIFISNFFSRVMGAIARLFLIVIGIIAQIFIFTAGIVVILLWVSMPFIIVFLLFLLFYV